MRRYLLIILLGLLAGAGIAEIVKAQIQVEINEKGEATIPVEALGEVPDKELHMPAYDASRPASSLLVLSCHMTSFNTDREMLEKIYKKTPEELDAFQQGLLERQNQALQEVTTWLTAEEWGEFTQKTQDEILGDLGNEIEEGEWPDSAAVLHECMVRSMAFADDYDALIYARRAADEKPDAKEGTE